MTKTILLADDSLTIQKVVELTFADTQYNVVSLSSGEELLEKLDEIGPELVICDIVMPGLEGYDVCQRIKSDPATLHIPVILLSGTFEPFDRDRALAAGCSEIITKPFEAKRLVDAVDTLLSPATDSATEDAGQEPTDYGIDEAAVATEEVPATVEFGTQLADGTAEPAATATDRESDDGIDFTTSGFAEMEAAGHAIREPDEEVADQPDETSGVGEEGPVTATGGAFEVDGDEEFADAFSSDTSPVDGPSLDDVEGSSDPFGDDDDHGAFPSAAIAEDDPFADGTDTVGAVEARPDVDAEVTRPEVSVDEPEFDLKSAEEAFDIDPQPVTITDADTAPVPGIPEDDEPAVAEPVPEPPEPVATGTGFSLSDDDVERIARRVVELAGDRLEQVAWEVIPDVAEVVVRERIRQLEAEFETEN
jgi:CheY-like chemotaxis protein